MPELSDEILMAFADDELSDDERADVLHQLERSAEDRLRLEMFTASRRGVFAETYQDDLEGLVPAHLLRVVDGFKDAQVRPSRQKPGRSTWQGFGNLFSSPFGAAPAFAALGLVAVIGAAGWVALDGSRAPVTLAQGVVIPTEHVLHEALETRVSGPAEPSGEKSARTVLTFKDERGRFCRQYELTAEKSSAFAGVACRDHSGADWAIEIHTAVAARKDNGNSYTPAAHAGAKSVRKFVEQRMTGELVTIEQEGELIKRKWETSN